VGMSGKGFEWVGCMGSLSVRSKPNMLGDVS
jgi:hypothetical protein